MLDTASLQLAEKGFSTGTRTNLTIHYRISNIQEDSLCIEARAVLESQAQRTPMDREPW